MVVCGGNRIESRESNRVQVESQWWIVDDVDVNRAAAGGRGKKVRSWMCGWRNVATALGQVVEFVKEKE